MSIRETRLVVSLYDNLENKEIFTSSFPDLNEYEDLSVKMNIHEYLLWRSIRKTVDDKRDCRLVLGYKPD